MSVQVMVVGADALHRHQNRAVGLAEQWWRILNENRGKPKKVVASFRGTGRRLGVVNLVMGTGKSKNEHCLEGVRIPVWILAQKTGDRQAPIYWRWFQMWTWSQGTGQRWDAWTEKRQDLRWATNKGNLLLCHWPLCLLVFHLSRNGMISNCEWKPSLILALKRLGGLESY